MRRERRIAMASVPAPSAASCMLRDDGRLSFCHFADNAGEATVPEALLEAGEHTLLVADFGIDHAIGMQTRQGNRGGKQVAAGWLPGKLSSIKEFSALRGSSASRYARA